MELDMDIKDGRNAAEVADARQEQYRPLWQERTALLLGDEALGRLRSSTPGRSGSIRRRDDGPCRSRADDHHRLGPGQREQ